MGTRGPKPGSLARPAPVPATPEEAADWAKAERLNLPALGPKLDAINAARRARRLPEFDLRAEPMRRRRLAEAAALAVAAAPGNLAAQKQCLADAVRADAGMLWVMFEAYRERALYNLIGRAVSELQGIGRRESTGGPGSRPWRSKEGAAAPEGARSRPRYPSEDRSRIRLRAGRTE